MNNLSLQLLFHDYDLVSHTTYVLCVNFYTWWAVQFKVDSERLNGILFILTVFARNLLRECHRRNIFFILCLVGDA